MKWKHKGNLSETDGVSMWVNASLHSKKDELSRTTDHDDDQV